MLVHCFLLFEFKFVFEFSFGFVFVLFFFQTFFFFLLSFVLQPAPVLLSAQQPPAPALACRRAGPSLARPISLRQPTPTPPHLSRWQSGPARHPLTPATTRNELGFASEFAVQPPPHPPCMSMPRPYCGETT